MKLRIRYRADDVLLPVVTSREWPFKPDYFPRFRWSREQRGYVVIRGPKLLAERFRAVRS